MDEELENNKIKIFSTDAYTKNKDEKKETVWGLSSHKEADSKNKHKLYYHLDPNSDLLNNCVDAVCEQNNSGDEENPSVRYHIQKYGHLRVVDKRQGAMRWCKRQIKYFKNSTTRQVDDRVEYAECGEGHLNGPKSKEKSKNTKRNTTANGGERFGNNSNGFWKSPNKFEKDFKGYGKDTKGFLRISNEVLANNKGSTRGSNELVKHFIRLRKNFKGYDKNPNGLHRHYKEFGTNCDKNYQKIDNLLNNFKPFEHKNNKFRRYSNESERYCNTNLFPLRHIRSESGKGSDQISESSDNTIYSTNIYYAETVCHKEIAKKKKGPFQFLKFFKKPNKASNKTCPIVDSDGESDSKEIETVKDSTALVLEDKSKSLSKSIGELSQSDQQQGVLEEGRINIEETAAACVQNLESDSLQGTFTRCYDSRTSTDVSSVSKMSFVPLDSFRKYMKQAEEKGKKLKLEISQLSADISTPLNCQCCCRRSEMNKKSCDDGKKKKSKRKKKTCQKVKKEKCDRPYRTKEKSPICWSTSTVISKDDNCGATNGAGKIMDNLLEVLKNFVNNTKQEKSTSDIVAMYSLNDLSTGVGGEKDTIEIIRDWLDQTDNLLREKILNAHDKIENWKAKNKKRDRRRMRKKKRCNRWSENSIFDTGH